MNPNHAWLAVLFAFLGLEAWAILYRGDRMQPATYWLRLLPWTFRAIAIVWLGFHFLVES